MSDQSPIELVEVHRADEALVAAFQRLIPQLSTAAKPPTLAELNEVAASPCTALLLARDGSNGEILGSLTLAFFRIPTGLRAWIEDVVVGAEARGQGIGEALNHEALRIAAERGAKTVDLTSRPSREAANRLYARMGFERRDTHVYRYEFHS